MRILIGLCVALSLAACAKPPATVDVAEPPQLDTFALAPVTLPRERVWDGVIEAVDQATLSAQTGGRVVELPFDVNDYVEAGQVVVRFTDVEQQALLRRARAQRDAAKAAFAEAESDHRRISELFTRQLVARAQLDQALARRDAAKAALDAADAALREAGQQAEYTVVRAPYSGILTERHVEVGETVRPGQPLVSGLSLARLRVAVVVPQSDIAAVREHRRAALLLADGVRVPAEKITVFPFADPETHSFKVRLQLPEVETGLQPGMTVKAAFVLDEAQRLLLPVRALARVGELHAVYVVGAHDVQLRQVRLGDRFDDRVEVLAGLAAGEAVASDPLAARAWLAGQHGARE